jgi:hypothetical protein
MDYLTRSLDRVEKPLGFFFSCGCPLFSFLLKGSSTVA